MKKYLIISAIIALNIITFGEEQGININNMYKNHQILITVPATIHADRMPPLPELTKERLLKKKIKKSKTTEEALTLRDSEIIEEKYTKAINAMMKDGTFTKIEEISKLYGVPPIHVAGAIIGEHTFNVDILDKVQNYFGLMYKGWLNYFDGNKKKFHEFMKLPEIDAILKDKNISDSDRWLKLDAIYQKQYSGKNGYPAGTILMAFFNPLGSGKSYGLGQMSPFRVLMANDIAHKYGGVPYVDPFNTEQLYKAVLDRELAIHYICANVLVSINYYKKNANFDLTDNPGMTATLYNIGFERDKSIQMYKKNIERIDKNGQLVFPEENYYGWYINAKRKEIEKCFVECRAGNKLAKK